MALALSIITTLLLGAATARCRPVWLRVALVILGFGAIWVLMVALAQATGAYQSEAGFFFLNVGLAASVGWLIGAVGGSLLARRARTK